MKERHLSCDDCGSSIERGSHWHPRMEIDGLSVLCGACEESDGRWVLLMLRTFWESDWGMRTGECCG